MTNVTKKSLTKPRGAPRVLTAEKEAEIVLAYATDRGASLRTLAARFGVGVNVVRGAVRRAKAAAK